MTQEENTELDQKIQSELNAERDRYQSSINAPHSQ